MPQTLAWVVRGIVALMFAVPAGTKLAGDPNWIAEFDSLGLGTWGLRAVAGLEIAASVLALVPSLSSMGVLLMIAITLGALVAQVTVIGNVIHIFVYLGLLVPAFLLLWRARQLQQRLPR